MVAYSSIVVRQPQHALVGTARRKTIVLLQPVLSNECNIETDRTVDPV